MLKSSNQNWCILFLFFFSIQEKIEESWSFLKATFTPNFCIIAVTKLKATFTPNFCIIAVTKLGCEIVQPRNLVEHAENWTCFARPYCGQDCVENYIPRYSKIERWLIFNDRVRFKN